MTVRTGTYYPAVRCKEAQLSAQRLQAYFLQRFPGTRNGGIFVCRTIAGSDKLSVHAEGRAGDLMTGTGLPTVETRFLAEQMRIFSQEIGLQGVIFNRQQWFCNRHWDWRYYGGVNPHVDHIHWELLPGIVLSTAGIQSLFEGPAPTGNVLYCGKTVRMGDSGDSVTRLQMRLNYHGASLVRDGFAGPKTVASVRLFQKLAGLQVDGVAGPITQGRLQ